MFQKIALLCLMSVAFADNWGYDYQKATFAKPHPIGHSEPVSISNSFNHEAAGSHQNLEKHFYYFSAPEENFDQSKEIKKVIGSTKKNLRVIFIKSPENKGYENAVLNLAKNAVEQKTHIYVLNKQPDNAELTQKFQIAQATTHHHKPEVHFVKYNTAADAEHAQRTIKAHYDSLGGGGGGQSVHVQGGVAPVINFVNSAGSDESTTGHVSNVNRQYLAPPITSNTNVNRNYLAPAISAVSRQYLAPTITSNTNVNRNYLAPAISAATNVNRAYLAPPVEDAPVDKNYAKDFLPSGSDVSPGTSYIPLTQRVYRQK